MPTAPAFRGSHYLSVSPAASTRAHSSPGRSKVDDLVFLKRLCGEPGMSRMFKLGHHLPAGPVGIYVQMPLE